MLAVHVGRDWMTDDLRLILGERGQTRFDHVDADDFKRLHIAGIDPVDCDPSTRTFGSPVDKFFHGLVAPVEPDRFRSILANLSTEQQNGSGC